VLPQISGIPVNIKKIKIVSTFKNSCQFIGNPEQVLNFFGDLQTVAVHSFYVGH
jgi:hypothetical protein